MKKLHVNIEKGYDIIVERNLLDDANECFNLDRKVLIISDSGVPREYIEKVRSKCKEASVIIFKK